MSKSAVIDQMRAREFQHAFWTYVRPESDLRGTAARKMAALDPDLFIEQMGEVPQDVAVIFSAEVAAHDRIAWSEILSRKGTARVDALRARLDAGRRPFLFASADHPARAMFEALFKRPDGIVLCAAVSRYLAWAIQQPPYRPHLFMGNAPVEPLHLEEKGPDRTGLLFDERDDDPDPSDPDGDAAGNGPALIEALDECREENDDDE